MCFNSAMEVMISYFLVFLLKNRVYPVAVEVYGNTFSSILNRNYTEDTVGSVRSELQCSMFCMITNHCEAIYYDGTAENSNCIVRKYTTNILYPLIIDTSLREETSLLFLQKPQHVWTLRDDYIYNSTLEFWYRVVTEPKAAIQGASDACKADGAYLMLIKTQADYDFVINIQHQLGKYIMYLQGTRLTESDEFVDELGRPLPFYQWDEDGTNGGGLYLRTNTDNEMETSGGDIAYRYICQVQLN